jgi:hypothetical protein
MQDNKMVCAEDFKIFDSLLSNKNPFAKGFVRIFTQDKNTPSKLIFEGYNLITGLGREFTAQRIFYQQSTSNNFKDYTLTSFGVGSGGASIASGSVVLADPTIDDVGLNSSIQLNSSYLTETSSGTTGVVKPITTGGSITLQDGGYGSETYYSKVKCTCLVNINEPTSISAGESVQISEAGLYFTSGTTTKLFSHICFTPKWKELESTLTIEWYIIC